MERPRSILPVGFAALAVLILLSAGVQQWLTAQVVPFAAENIVAEVYVPSTTGWEQVEDGDGNYLYHLYVPSVAHSSRLVRATWRIPRVIGDTLYDVYLDWDASADLSQHVEFKIYDAGFSFGFGNQEEKTLALTLDQTKPPAGPIGSVYTAGGQLSAWIRGPMNEKFIVSALRLERRADACAAAGEHIPVVPPEMDAMQCCPGLQAIPVSVYVPSAEQGEIAAAPQCIHSVGSLLCSDCGNGVCEEWENICNCPQDCGEEFREGDEREPHVEARPCASTSECSATLVCSVEERYGGVCNTPPDCRPGEICPAVCYGECIPCPPLPEVGLPPGDSCHVVYEYDEHGCAASFTIVCDEEKTYRSAKWRCYGGEMHEEDGICQTEGQWKQMAEASCADRCEHPSLLRSEPRCGVSYFRAFYECQHDAGCTDSDDKDPYQRGVTCVGDDCVVDECLEPDCANDEDCYGVAQVIEYYCENNERADVVITCEYGCQDGACLKGSTECYDTDGGKNILQFGSVYTCTCHLDVGGIKRCGCTLPVDDECSDETTVREGFCDGTQIAFVEAECPQYYVCETGVCVSTPTKAALDTIDTNADGIVTAEEVALFLRFFLQEVSMPQETAAPLRFDFNRDGRTNLLDLLYAEELLRDLKK